MRLGFRFSFLLSALLPLLVQAAAPDDIALGNLRTWFDGLDTQALTYSSTSSVPIYPGNVGTGITASNITSWKSKVNGYTALSSHPGLTSPATSNTYPGIGASFNGGDNSLAVQGDIWGTGAAVSTPEIFVVTSPASTTAQTFFFDSQQVRLNTTSRISAHFPWSGGLIYWDPICCGTGRSASYTPVLNQLLITNWFADSSARTVKINGTTTILTGSASGTYTNNSTLASPSYYTLGGGEPGLSYVGVISENVVYNRVLFEAEKRILNNYFAAKWGMSIATDSRYQGDTVANGLYRYHVGGIGSETSGNQNTGTSEGLTVTNGSFLAAGRYLIAGLPGLSPAGTMTAYNQSNAGTTAKVVTAPQLLRGTVTTDLPSTAWWRGARVWYIDKTDASSSTGTVDLTFDITGKMGIATPNVDPLPATAVSAGQPLQLLFRAATTGAFSTVITATASSASSVTFAVPANLINDGYYTIADYRPPKMSLAKSVVPVSDPVNGVTPTAKNIPGGVVEYSIILRNTGESLLSTGASNSLVLADVIPPDLDMNPAISMVCTGNGTAMTLAPSNVTYYSDAAATTVMTPTAGFDPLIRAFKAFPQGAIQCPGNFYKCIIPNANAIPACTFKFQLKIK